MDTEWQASSPRNKDGLTGVDLTLTNRSRAQHHQRLILSRTDDHPRRPGISVLKLVGFSVVSAIAALIDHFLPGNGAFASSAALAGGVGLAGLVIFGSGYWPAIVIAQLAGVALPGDGPPGAALVSALGGSIGIIVAARAILRMHLPTKPDNLEAMLRYIAFGAGAVAVLSAASAVAGTLLFGPAAPASAVLVMFFQRLTSGFAWTLIVGCFLQACWSERRQPLPGPLALPVLATAAGVAVFLYYAPVSVDFIWCFIPLLAWAGIVGKVRGAGLALLLVLVPVTVAHLTDGFFPGRFLWPGFLLFLCIAGPTALVMAALNMESSLHRRSQRSLLLGSPHEGRFEYYPRSQRFKIDQDVKELLGVVSEGSVVREEAVLAGVVEDDRPSVEEFLRELTSGPTPEPRHVEFRVSTAPGKEIWLAADGVSVAAHIGGDRLPTASYGVIRDISEQKESQQRLLDSDRFLHCLIENLVTFVAVLKPDGTVIETNRPPVQAGGGTDEVIGRKLWDCFWWGRRDEVQAILVTAVAEARDGVATEHDLQMRTSQGDLIWMEVQVAPMRDENGAITHLIVSGSDLTDRLEAESQAHRMAAIIESTPDFVGMMEPDGRFIYVSPGGMNLMNAPEDMDFLGRDLASVHPERDREVLLKEAWPAVCARGLWEGQTHLLTVDGQERPVSQVILGHFDQQGELQRVSTVMRDMTEQKRAEEQQRVLLRELAHRVKNTLAVIQGFTRQTLRVHPDPQEFSRVFQGRVASLAASHSLLTESGWRGADLREVVQMQLSPTAPKGGGRLSLDGPDVVLPSETATTLGLILHELGINAAQHGGWAGDSGHVFVRWRQEGNILHIAWEETEISTGRAEAAQSGFGSSLLDMSVMSVQRRLEDGRFLLDFEMTLFPETELEQQD